MLKNKASLWSKSHLVISRALFLVLTVVIITPNQADAYYMNGVLSVFAAPDGEWISRSIPNTPVTTLSDSGASSGSSGTYAEGSYFANLHTARLGTYLVGNGDPLGNGLRLESGVVFADGLTFTIPAGTYSTDLSVSLNAFIRGSLSASGCSDSNCSWATEFIQLRLQGSLGSDFVSDSWQVFPDTSPGIIWEDYTLTARILRAGTYATEQSAYFTVDASLIARADDPISGFAPLISVLSDFNHTAGFTSVIVPDDVTWTSDSGVFLSQTVPLPGAFWLFGTVLLGLISLQRRRR